MSIPINYETKYIVRGFKDENCGMIMDHRMTKYDKIMRREDETRIRMNNKRQLGYITEFLEMFYAWPKANDPDNVNFKLFLKTISFLSAVGFPALYTVFHMYHFRSVPKSQLAEDLITLLHVVCPLIMALFYLIHLKGTVALFQLLPDVYHWEAFINKDRIDYKKWAKVYKIVFLLFTVTIMICLEFDYDNCEKRKIKNNSIHSCGVFIPYYLPFDFKASIVRHYILLHQEIGISVGFLVLHHILFIQIFYIDKTFCLMDYMISLLTDLNTSIEDDRKVEEYLRKIINIHQITLRINKWFNKLLRYFQMTLCVSVRVVLAVIIFYTVVVGYNEFVVFSLIWIIGISLFDIAGQLLINKNMEFETAVYNVEWYKMNKIKDRRNYRLLYLMSQRPITLDAGPSLHLSYPLLLETFQETYSFTAMLLRMST